MISEEQFARVIASFQSQTAMAVQEAISKFIASSDNLALQWDRAMKAANQSPQVTAVTDAVTAAILGSSRSIEAVVAARIDSAVEAALVLRLPSPKRFREEMREVIVETMMLMKPQAKPVTPKKKAKRRAR